MRRKCGCDDMNDGKCVCDICQGIVAKSFGVKDRRTGALYPVAFARKSHIKELFSLRDVKIVGVEIRMIMKDVV